MFIKRLKPILLPTKIIQVNDTLYRGNAIFSPVKAIRIKRKGIKQVIDLRNTNNTIGNPFKFLEKLYCKILNIKYYNLDFHMTKSKRIPEIDFFNMVNEQINKGEKTYIHCHYGLHRTGFAVAMHQKSKNIPTNIILENLMQNSWNNKEEKINLKLFLDKFFQ